MSISDRIDDVVQLTDRLEALMARETELIKGKKPQDIAAFTDEKAHVAALYTREMRAFKREVAGQANLPTGPIARLRASSEKLRETLSRHSRLLTRLRRVSEGLIKTIADDVAAKRAPTIGYGPSATYNAPQKAGGSASSLIVNDIA